MQARTLLPLIGLLLAAAPMAAQDSDPSPPLALAFKHMVGKVQKYRLDTNADLMVTSEGGPLPQLPIGMKTVMTFTEKVTGEKDGAGTLTVQPLVMTVDTQVMGMSRKLKAEGGKVTMDGKPVPAAANLTGGLSGRPVTLQRSLNGTLSGKEGAGVQAMLGSSYLLRLPEQPVTIGESWESTLVVQPNLPLGGPSQPIPEIEIKLKHTLKSTEVKQGRTHALIETTGAGSTPDGSDMKVKQEYQGVTRFDATAGSVVSAAYTMDLKMDMPLPAAAFGGPAPEGTVPPRIKVEGAMKFGLAELPLTVAPAKKPAPKPAPVRKPLPAKKVPLKR
jgi:hypothetical protein